MTASPTALAPFFKAMRTVLGTQAATTGVSVPGGLYLQKLGLRNTNDIDVVIKGVGGIINRGNLRNDIVQFDKTFTINYEKICGVTWRDPVTKLITPIDIIDESVTGFMPTGALLSQLRDTDIPWPTGDEVIKMKILAARDRFDDNKGLRDLDDVKDLILKAHVSMTYKNPAEKDMINVALQKALLRYPAMTGWSEKDWKTNLNLF